MAVKKRELKKGIKVTFTVDKKHFPEAENVALIGDFNGWNPAANPMKKLKSGKFSADVTLEKGRDYQFRYLLDGTTYVNDEEADRYTHSGVGDSENGVICL